jgi:hypothetical protein
MSDKPDGRQAFSAMDGDKFTGTFHPGLSKREWFAGMALANLNLQSHIAKPGAEALAESAFNIADAMIKQSIR